MEPRIRKAAAADLAAVERIEIEQFSNPWNRDYYAAELANSMAHFLVIEGAPGGEVAGYLLFWRLAGELELHKIAIAAAWQRRGLGTRLLDYFIEAGRSWGSERGVLEVRSSNIAAIRLYERRAFRPVATRRDYYDHPREDALVFALRF